MTFWSLEDNAPAALGRIILGKRDVLDVPEVGMTTVEEIAADG